MKPPAPPASARFDRSVQERLAELTTREHRAYMKAYNQRPDIKAKIRAEARSSIYLNHPVVFKSVERIRSPSQRIDFLNRVMAGEIARLRGMP